MGNPAAVLELLAAQFALLVAVLQALALAVSSLVLRKDQRCDVEEGQHGKNAVGKQHLGNGRQSAVQIGAWLVNNDDGVKVRSRGKVRCAV